MSGKGGNNRKGYRRKDREREKERDRDSDNGQKKPNLRYDKGRGNIYERLQWIPPVKPSEPLPIPDCPYCGKPIKDIISAINDRSTNTPVHFDCIINHVFKNEPLEKGEMIAYIGGGRFGVVQSGSAGSNSSFTIKKIIEWEDKENRAEWRRSISDYYSLT